MQLQEEGLVKDFTFMAPDLKSLIETSEEYTDQ